MTAAGTGAAGGGSVAEPNPVIPVRGPVGSAPARGGCLRETLAGKSEGEEEAGTVGEGGLPTSDPADGGHMAAASQIKRLRLGGSAITAV